MANNPGVVNSISAVCCPIKTGGDGVTNSIIQSILCLGIQVDLLSRLNDLIHLN